MAATTARTITEAKGVSERTIRAAANAGGWPFLQRAVQGGPQKVFLPALLPAEIQEALPETRQAGAKTRSTGTPNTVVVSALASIKGWQREVWDARLALYRELERLQKIHGTARAVTIMTARIKHGELPVHLQRLVVVANARSGGKTGKRTLSRSSLYTWLRDVRKDGITGLIPKPARSEQQIPEWAPYFLKCYQKPQKPSIPEAMAEMQLIMPQGAAMPSYHQVRRWQKARSRLDVQRGRHSAGALKRFRGYCRRSTDNLMPMDVVQCDGHSFKAKVANPFHGRPFKPEACAVVDVKTKMCLGWSAGLAESAHTVADALRHTMTVNEQKPWGGVPAILYTDKGAGNMAHMLNDKVTGTLSRAGVEHHTGIPGNAQGRGLIEKTNQKLWISAARKLDTFVGQGMDALAQRSIYLKLDKEVRQTGTCMLSELPTWPQFLAICEQAMRDYNNTPHTGLKKIKDNTGHIRHMTPAEAWFTALREGWNPTLLDPEILEDLFRPQVIRKTRRAQIELFGNIYFNPALEHYHGEKVIIEYDIHDHQAVRIRDTQHRLICLAQLDRNKRDFFPVPEIERARDKRAAGRIGLLQRKIEDVKAERQGVTGIDVDTALLVEADAGAVDLVLSRKDVNPDLLINVPNPQNQKTCTAPESDPESAPESAPDTTPHQLISTKSEQFNLLLNNLRGEPRPLTAEECKFLNAYYLEDGGRMYLKMVGDLRVEYGVAGEEQDII